MPKLCHHLACFYITTSFFMAATKIFCLWPVFMSRPIFPAATGLFFVQLACAVTTQFVMSRHDFFAFVLKPLSRLKNCVTTSFLSVHLFLCRDMKIYVATSKHLFILKYVGTLTLLVATKLVHPLSALFSRPSFLVAPENSSLTSFLSQQTFPCCRS